MAAASVTPPDSLEVLQPGYSTSLLGTKLEAKYLCSACGNVLRRPFQAQCGHRYCSFCLSGILRCGGRRVRQRAACPERPRCLGALWVQAEHAGSPGGSHRGCFCPPPAPGPRTVPPVSVKASMRKAFLS